MSSPLSRYPSPNAGGAREPQKTSRPWQSIVTPYAIAIAVSLLAMGLTLWISPLRQRSPFLLFILAIMLSAWYGGLGPGLVASLVATLAGVYFYAEPPFSLILADWTDLVRISIFVVVALAVSSLTAAHRQAEQDARERAEHLSVTLASIGDAVIATDAEGAITFVNPIAQALTGWREAEARGRTVSDVFRIVSEESHQPVTSPFEMVKRESKILGLANPALLIARDGREILIEDSGAPIRDGIGNFIGIVLVFRDVTARRHAEKELEMRAALIDLSPDAIMTRKLDGTIMFWSQGAEALYGWTSDEIIGLKTHDTFQTQFFEPRERVEDELLRDGRWEGDLIHTRKDGTRITVHSHWLLQRDEENHPTAILETNLDITERKHAEEERLQLLASAQAARAEAEHTAERISRLQVVTAAFSEALTPEQVSAITIQQGVAAMDAASGSLVLFDEQDGALHIVDSIGYPDETVTFWKTFSPAAHLPLAEAFTSGKPIFIDSGARAIQDYPEIALAPKSQSFQARAAIPLIVKGRAIGGIGLAFRESHTFDAKDRAFMLALVEQCAQALDRARLFKEAQDAIRIRDQFLAIASHELKTPLTSIVGYAELLQSYAAEDAHFDAVQMRAIQTIAKQTSRLNKMITALFDLSRLEGGQLSLEVAPVDLVALAARVIEEAKPTSSCHVLEFRRPTVPLIVNGDELRLDQVFQNLISNAFKYSPSGGRVLVQVAQQGAMAVVTVADQGIGISASDLPKVFERFYRAQNANALHIGGLGVGLFVVREIVRRHGGNIEVESELERGSTFTVRLPLIT